MLYYSFTSQCWSFEITGNWLGEFQRSPWYTGAIFPKGGTALCADSLVPLTVVLVVSLVEFITGETSHQGKCVHAVLHRINCTFHNLVLFTSSLWFTKVPSHCLCCFIARIYRCFWPSICWCWLFNTGMTCFLHTKIICFSDYPIIHRCWRSFNCFTLLLLCFHSFWLPCGLTSSQPGANPGTFPIAAMFPLATARTLRCRPRCIAAAPLLVEAEQLGAHPRVVEASVCPLVSLALAVEGETLAGQVTHSHQRVLDRLRLVV